MSSTQAEFNKKNCQSWFLLAVFSTIALTSLTSSFRSDSKIGDQPGYMKWAVSATSCTLAFSTLATFAYPWLKEKFIATNMETGLAVLTCGMWAAVLPTLMKPDNELAVSTTNGINHANLYFSAWASLLLSLAVFFRCTDKYAKKIIGHDDPERKDRKLALWGGVVASTAIVAVSGGRLWQSYDCDVDANDGDSHTDVCSRLKYGVAIGGICCVVSIIWMILSRCLQGKCGDITQAIIVWVSLALWIVGIIYLTYPDEEAPATQPGNVYFFTWISFALFAALAVNSVMNFFNKNDDEDADQKDEGDKAEQGDDEGDKAEQGDDEVPKDEAAAAEEGEATKTKEDEAEA